MQQPQVTLNGFSNNRDGVNSVYIKTDTPVVDYFINGLGALTIKLEDGSTITLYND